MMTQSGPQPEPGPANDDPTSPQDVPQQIS